MGRPPDERRRLHCYGVTLFDSLAPLEARPLWHIPF